MNQITKNLACEWAKDSIRNKSVTPWVIRTPLAEQFIAKEDYSKMVVYDRTPLRRLGEAEEVSPLVAFLC
ncbi:hypothetical protein AMTR_s00012p00260930 [Amborella trichopoda]|uniref:Uncharacterized protein n=1 Tax=Amborella trichopoda TaxID=13333 RepID=W1PJW7_AMBTC|nr:hypothetical protein AMTR_s00012p00260930 [Amborella trichopoda]